MEAADPVLSEPPQYRDPTWPGVYIEASGSIPVQWRAGTDGKWRADYAALAECALDMAADRRESPARRKAARELAGLLKQYLAFGTPRKKEGWFVAWGPEARKHLDKMDRVGSRMQALAVRLGFASASQPVYVPSASVRGRVLQERLTRQTGIVKAWAATRPAEGRKARGKQPDGSRFRLDRARQRVQVNGTWYDLTDRQTQALSVLHEKRGKWVSGRACDSEMHKVRGELPSSVRRLVDSKKGPFGGYRLKPSLFV